jgi:hypothetical protein
MEDLWHALDQALIALRLPLYHRRLGRAMPKPAAYEIAIQISPPFSKPSQQPLAPAKRC